MAYRIDRDDEHIVLPDGPATVRDIQKYFKQRGGSEFYELEAAEVIECWLDEEDLPLVGETDEPDWSKYGWIAARMSVSNSGIDDIVNIRPLDTNIKEYPYPGEHVIIASYYGQKYYTQKLNLNNSVNLNSFPGLSKVYDMWTQEIYKDNLPMIGNFSIKELKAEEGDIIFNGRFGQSIRFGSNVKEIIDKNQNLLPDTGIPQSPNVIIRAGQGVEESNANRPVNEEINLDGSSIWMTTDQSVKLDRTKSNSQKHRLMSKVHFDKNPIYGGKQIVINSDRITFNTKRNEIMGYSALGIGWGTPWSFTIDADRQFCVSTPRIRFYTGEYSVLVGPDAMDRVVGGGHPDSGEPEPFPSDLASACGISIGEKVLISSACPSFLILDDKAHLQSCKGAILHLDDCAGLKDNQGSFLRIGGEALGITGYVKGRDDMGQQHLVYGEELTNILDSVCNSFIELGETILNLAGIPTGAGPSGPISGGPTNTPAIEAWKAGVETIRARLCDLLMKPE